MKKNLTVLLCLCTLLANAANWKDKTSQPTPAKYESFENGIPKTWVLQGTGKLSISPWHYKLGKKSLQWDFAAGDIIKINNTIGEPDRVGGMNNVCFSCFGIWLYAKKAMPGKNLRFEFCSGSKRDAYIDVPLNFKGWQCAYICYNYNRDYDNRIYLQGKVSARTDNILIKAPKNSSGQILMDLVVYNGPRYVMFANILPNKTPWRAPAIDAKKYPVPEKISDADKKAVERIMKRYAAVNITDHGRGSACYKEAMRQFKKLKIVEDAHGIRGKPVQVGRDHAYGEYWFYSYNGIPKGHLESYNSTMLYTFDKKRKHLWKFLYNTSFAISRGISKSQYEELCKASVKVWKYMIDQGTNTSYGYGNYYTHTYEGTAAALCKVKDALFKSSLMDELFQYAQYRVYPLFVKKEKPSMDSYGAYNTYFALVSLYSNDPRKQVQALRFISDRMSAGITEDNGALGFKVDGCGYHGISFSVDYMRNGIRGASEIVRIFSGSSFALSDEAFNILKKVALRLCFYSSNGELPIFMQGTGVFGKGRQPKYKAVWLPRTLKNLALSGKNGCDKDLAQAYVNLKAVIKKSAYKYDDIFERKYGIKPSGPPQGNISMPYAPLVTQRRKDWVATAWGGGVDMRDRGNHYGYNIDKAPLSIMNKGGFYGSGSEEAGWDWNRINGTTVLYMPNITAIRYIHAGRKVPKGKGLLRTMMVRQYQASKKNPKIKRGNGGISWRGVNGTFRRIFRGDRFYNDFSGIKSYFFVDDRIYALGSNIKSDNAKYHVQTNLYQKALKTKDSVTFVDGKAISAFPVTDRALDGKKPHRLIDPQGNGYFVPAGQKLFVARKHQKSRDNKGKKATAGDFATAWLEHGVKCTGGKYVYIVMPYCDKNKLAKFSSKDYQILRQDDFAHILHDKIDNFYAGIFFKGGAVSRLPHVKNVERDCQIMYKEFKVKSFLGLSSKSSLEIAVGDPDTHRHWTGKMHYGAYGGKSELTPLKITFAGRWKLEKAPAGVKIISSGNDKTIIEFACIHGKDFNFTLTGI